MRALVTVGSTKFEELVRAVDSLSFAKALREQGFNELVIQTGSGHYLPLNTASSEGRTCVDGLHVRHFTYTNNLAELIATSSLIISHAGSGSIFEALTRSGSTAALVVVPNPLLMDNHQAELGQHLEALGHLVCATPATQALIAAVQSLQSGCSSVPYTKGSAMGIAHHISNIVLQS